MSEWVGKKEIGVNSLSLLFFQVTVMILSLALVQIFQSLVVKSIKTSLKTKNERPGGHTETKMII